MSIRIYLAPAGAGKTEYIVSCAIEAASEMRCHWVILPSAAQLRAFRQRLAHHGGALGVQALTFPELYKHLLQLARRPISQLAEPVRHRLLRATVDRLCDAGRLSYYAPLRSRPGFVRALGEFLRELKQGMIAPKTLSEALGHYDRGGPRLAELAVIYESYQSRLQTECWADDEGMGWLAVEALDGDVTLARDCSVALVDGFDGFNSIQLALLRLLAERAGEVIITLTGEIGRERPAAHSRFQRALKGLQSALGTVPEPLPGARVGHLHSTICYLESSLFELEREPAPCAEPVPVEMLEVSDRASEAREALRWCKARIAVDGVPPSQVALLARNIEPYRPFLLDVAREFGLPVRLSAGMPLDQAPVIQGIMDLLRLVLPLPGSDDWAMPRRRVVEAWRNPYFDWNSALAGEDDDGAALCASITLADARALDEFARQGLVIQGMSQWLQAFDELAGRGVAGGETEDGDPRPNGLRLSTVSALQLKFGAFAERLRPPVRSTYRGYVRWLEDLIGDDPRAQRPGVPLPAAASLNIPARLAQDENQGDRAALRQFSEVLRGLVWAEERLELGQIIDYARFVAELEGAVQATVYAPHHQPACEDLLLANLHDARGVSFQAIAIVGLAEGEFPQIVREDPLLWEVDRQYLQQQGLNIDLRLQSDEPAFFYEAITRGRERLLLTRPRLADDGAPWQPSPYWDEIRRLTSVQPRRQTAALSSSEQVASPVELLEWLTEQPTDDSQMLDSDLQEAWARVAVGSEALAARSSPVARGVYDGDLAAVQPELCQRFGPRHVWSSSRIEGYLGCAFSFFMASVLKLEARREPVEGYDAAQRGSMMHAILEKLYRQPADTSEEDLLSRLPQVAAVELAQAPQRYAFRATAWWEQTCQEIVAELERNVRALCDPKVRGDWQPRYLEARFGLPDLAGKHWHEPLIVRQGEDTLRLRGVIDRIDVNSRGELRVIDYKSGSGGSDYGESGLEKGRKLQIPLYALAARDALHLGEPVEGFYWHLGKMAASSLKLQKVGFEWACEQALQHAWKAVMGARAGRFQPRPPAGDCPPWCPAVGFCWRYRGRSF